MKVLIADRQIIFRKGLVHVLRENFDPIEIWEAETASTALPLIADVRELDLVVVGLRFPETSAWPVIETCRRLYPDVRVLAISAANAPETVTRLRRAGVDGCISRVTDPAAVVHIIHLLLSGTQYFPFLDGLYPPDPESGSVGTDGQADAHTQEDLFASTEEPETADLDLTPRQIDVLQGVVEGKSNKEIARYLSISEGTVKVHVRAVMRKIGVKNRTQLAVKTSRLNLFTRRDS